jgi:hypothetical protein
MSRPSSVHYLVIVDGDDRVREFPTFDDACDALVFDCPTGVEFTVQRVRDGVAELLLRATKSTTRDPMTHGQ